MKNCRLIFIALFLLFATNVGCAQASNENAVRITLENYIKGQTTGDAEYIRKAFHAEGNLIFIRSGKYTTWSCANYIAGMKDGKPAADEASRKRSIESVDVNGNAASAKIVLDYPNVNIVDYMSLLKTGDDWKIVSKVFYAQPKQTAAAKKTQ